MNAAAASRRLDTILREIRDAVSRHDQAIVELLAEAADTHAALVKVVQERVSELEGLRDHLAASAPPEPAPQRTGLSVVQKRTRTKQVVARLGVAGFVSDGAGRWRHLGCVVRRVGSKRRGTNVVAVWGTPSGREFYSLDEACRSALDEMIVVQHFCRGLAGFI